MSAKESYKGHRVGSRAGMIHKIFDDKGQDAAKKKYDSLEISPGCYYGWFKDWRGDGVKSKTKSTKRPAKRAKTAQEGSRKKAKANARAKVKPDDKVKADAKVKGKKKSTRAAIAVPTEDAA